MILLLIAFYIAAGKGAAKFVKFLKLHWQKTPLSAVYKASPTGVTSSFLSVKSRQFSVTNLVSVTFLNCWLCGGFLLKCLEFTSENSMINR